MGKSHRMFVWLLPALLLLTGVQLAGHVELPALPCDDCAPTLAAPHSGPCDNPEHHHHPVHEHCAICAVHAAKGVVRAVAVVETAQQSQRLVTAPWSSPQTQTVALPSGRGPPSSLSFA